MKEFKNGLIPYKVIDHAIKYSLVGLVTGFFLLLILFPLSSMFVYSSQGGLLGFISKITSPAALFSLKFSLIVAFSATLCNVAIGTIVAHVLTKYDFPGKKALDAFVDLPIAVPTAVAGFTLLLLYGPAGLFGKYFSERGITLMFAFPGILLAHIFITFPFVVRSVSAVLERLEKKYEEVARTLGASGFQTFIYVTLPSIKDGLLAGSILTFARSLGEFGATIMVSGNLAMRTQTAPLYIFSRFNTGDIQGASAVAVVLAVLSFSILYGLKYFMGESE